MVLDQTTQTQLDIYVEAFEAAKERVGDVEIAAAILHEIGKTQRTEMLRGNRPSNNEGKRVIDGDAPASDKQLSFLKRLGVKAESGVTKSVASQLIDNALANGE